MMLLPLAIGLFVKARYAPTADHLQPDFSKISGMAIVIGVVGILVMEFETILATFGAGGILAALLFLVSSLALGMLLGGNERSVMGLSAAQRNLSAAILVAAQNFSDGQQVLGMVMVIGVLGLVLLGVVSGEMGKRSTAASDTAAPAQPASAT